MRGQIRLMAGKGHFAKNQAVYTSKSERNAIIDSWRLLYGDRMVELKWFIQIRPFYDSVNDNKWSRKV